MASEFKSKRTDSKGRVTLGKRFANRTVLVQVSGNEAVIKLAPAIPEDEAWLHENAKALTSVKRGLAEARAHRFAEPVDLGGDGDLARSLND